jgi:hypothetical protein
MIADRFSCSLETWNLAVVPMIIYDVDLYYVINYLVYPVVTVVTTVVYVTAMALIYEFVTYLMQVIEILFHC